MRLYDFFLACHPLMPIYFAAVVGTGQEPATRLTIVRSSQIIFPKGKPGDCGKMQNMAFPRLMSLDTVLCTVNERVVGEKYFV